MTEHPKSRICAAPWTQLNTKATGHFRLCCRVNKKYQYAYDADGKPYHANTHSAIDWINSDYLNDIKRRMLSGEDLPECSRCYRAEDLGGTSHRMLSKNRWDVTYPGEDFTKSKFPMDVEARLGNLCNLKCVMCGPAASSQHQKERLELRDKGTVDKLLRVLENTEWNTQNLVDGIVDISEHIRILRLYGGEPTVMPEVHNMLEKLVENESAKNIHLKFNTNLTNINERFLELMKQFSHVSIHVSVDGYGTVQEYIRFPSKWDAIERNIKTVMDLVRDSENINVVFMPTIQILNIMDVSRLIHWLDEQKKERNVEQRMNISFSMVENPQYFQPELLPLSSRDEVIKRLESFRELDYVDEKCVDLVINTLKQNVVLDYLYNDFWRIVRIYDEHRGNSLEESNKELYDIMRIEYRDWFLLDEEI